MTIENQGMDPRPIPYAGFWLAVTCIAAVWLAAYPFISPAPLSPAKVLALGGIAVVCVFAGYSPIRNAGGFGMYVLRNARGQEWVCFRSEGRVQSEVQSCGSDFRYGGFFSLHVPYGGWFRRPRLIERGPIRPVPWKKIRKVVCHPGDDGMSTLRVWDRHGNRALISADEALRLAEDPYAHDFGRLMMTYRRWADDWRARSEQTDLERAQWRTLVVDCADILGALVGKIAATKRYRFHSKEAAEIQSYGQERLAHLRRRIGEIQKQSSAA